MCVCLLVCCSLQALGVRAGRGMASGAVLIILSSVLCCGSGQGKKAQKEIDKQS